jgi:hypothetical protein
VSSYVYGYPCSLDLGSSLWVCVLSFACETDNIAFWFACPPQQEEEKERQTQG